MQLRTLGLTALATSLGLLAATGSRAGTQALDAVSGGSVVVGTVTATETTAKIPFTEPEVNGSLRLYYAPQSFTTADTAGSSVTRLSVTTRGSGSVSLAGLKAGTTYFYRFQGYYPGKNVTNYTASGSFATTAASSALHASRSRAASLPSRRADALGRPAGAASGARLSEGAATPSLGRSRP